MSYREGRFWQPDVTVATVVVRDGKLLCVQLKQHKRSYKVGMKLRLYLQENAKVYERDGALLIYDYILIEQRTSSVIDEPKSP